MGKVKRVGVRNAVGLGVVFVVGLIIVTTVASIQRHLPTGRALTPVSPLSQAQAVGTFTETFDTTTNRDTGATTAAWGGGSLSLPAGAGSWRDPSGATPGESNVSDNGSYSDNNDLLVDAAGRVHLVWSDTAEGDADIYYSLWSNGKWTRADGVTLGFDNISAMFSPTDESVYPELAIDGAGVPTVVWEDAGAIILSRWDTSTGSWHGLLALGAPDVVQDTVTTNNSAPFVRVDGAGNPHVVWTRTSCVPPCLFAPRYKRWDGSDYVNAAGDSTAGDTLIGGDFSFAHDVSVDTSNKASLIFTDFDFFTGTSLHYTEWNGVSWVKADGVTAGNNVVVTAPSVGSASLQQTSTNHPAIAFSDDSGGTLDAKYTVYDGSSDTWVGPDGSAGPSTIASFGGAGMFSLELGTADMPNVAWEDDPSGMGSIEVLYATWDGSSWVGVGGGALDNFSDMSGTTEGPSLSLEPDGDPWLSFENSEDGDQDVYVTRWVEPVISPATAQSLTIDTTPELITSATLTATQTVPAGTSVSYELSVDGGATWSPATSGSPVAFSANSVTSRAIGSDLRWRATLTSSDPASSPFIESLTISYSTSAAEELIRVSGADPVEIALQVSQFRFSPGGAEAAILATRDKIVDALVSVPLAARTNAVLLVTSPDSLSPGVLEELQRVLGTPYGNKTVFIAGGTEALPQKIADELSTAGFTNQQRFAGENRDDTARLIALEIAARNSAPLQEIAVSENQAFADTLGTGSAAAQPDDNGDPIPILLTTRNSPTLSPYFVQFLQSQPQVTQIYVVGGPSAVHPDALTALQAALPGASIEVIAGDNRYGTNAELNNLAFGGPSSPATIVVASGEAGALPGAITTSSVAGGSFFTALLAGTIGIDEQAPVVLTLQANLPQEIIDYLTPLATSINKVIIVGDTGVVSDAVEQQLRNLVL